MHKVFSHKVALQILVAVLIILLLNSYIRILRLNNYVNETMYRNLNKTMEELEQLNIAINGFYEGGDFEENNIELEYASRLDGAQLDIEKIFDMPRAVFSWYDAYNPYWILKGLKKRGYITARDKDYLECMHSYNERLIQAYNQILQKNNVDNKSLSRDYSKIEKIYKEFMEEADKMAKENEYQERINYSLSSN